MYRLMIVSIWLIGSSLYAISPTVGQIPSLLTLEGKRGGLVKDGSPWSSVTLAGKPYLVLYVDPDEADLNESLTERLKKESFGPEKLGSVAIINMAATWKPNFAISAKLSEKQKDFPATTYVKDYHGALVKEWDLADDNYDVLLFDKAGKVVFRKDGKLSSNEIERLIALIKEHIQ